MATEKAPAAATATAGTALSAESVSALEAAIQETDIEASEAKSMVDALVSTVMDGTAVWGKSVSASLRKAIDALDQRISAQLAEIMHAPEFQKLEGTWRGLHHLVFGSETSATLKIKVLNAPKRDLFKDLDTAVEFDQSQTFKKVYENEFGMAGGEPYGALIGDYEFDGSEDDMSMLGKMSNIAAAGFCPFITAPAPKLFGFKGFTELSKPRDLEKIFEADTYIKWRSFRDSEDSRFVTFAMPRVLSRLPYGKNTKPVDEFNFEEVELAKDGKPKAVGHENYTWMNAAYVLGAKLTDAFAKYGWCTAIRGVEGGGKVEGLPTHVFTSDDGDLDTKCPTEIAITDRREAELSKLGFLPLCHFKRTDYAAFMGGQTVQKPKKYDKPAATANAAISARLPYILAMGRISHYLKVIARDKIGSFMEANECQDWLNRWIADYVLLSDKPSQEMKAKYPLAEARIEVQEVPGAPGSYNAIAYLRPWLQFEELRTSMRLVASIPKKQG